MDEILLPSLTPAQRAAIEHTGGPLLIVAGPGAGKTDVMVRRTAGRRASAEQEAERGAEQITERRPERPVEGQGLRRQPYATILLRKAYFNGDTMTKVLKGEKPTAGSHLEQDTLVRVKKMLVKLRYQAARLAFRSDADLARSLGVHRSNVVRWRRGESPALKNWEQLVGLDTVVSLLAGFLDERSISKWLHGLNAHLGDRRPIDVIRQGRLSEVVAAIEAEKAGAFA